ncbi:MAG: anthranilate synthase component I [Aestuariivita sp.]|nr:anthranilate synthase component I [Aestuariivita sp.]
MGLTPGVDEFATAYNAGNNQIVHTRLPADLDTPVSLMLKLTDASKFSFLLESVTGGETRGRYSIVGMKPDLIWRCNNAVSEMNRSARFNPIEFKKEVGNPLDNLRSLIEESQIDLPDDLPQAAAGLFGYLGYDMIRHVEDLPNINPDPIGLPDSIFIRPSVIVVLDGVKSEVRVVAPAWVRDGQSAQAAYTQAAERVMDAVNDIAERVPPKDIDLRKSISVSEPESNYTPEDYMAAVAKAKDYIQKGDIFQVVPSQRWKQRFDAPPFSLYRSLRRYNPSPFMFFFNFGDFQVIGSSPEILVRVFGQEVTIRPLAGTRPRGASPQEDRALETELLADTKERAEHLMLLDLARNDVGRVAKVGTVQPTEKFIVERYSHVMHIVSNVVGEMSEGKSALDALFAGMPAGTVSGTPKVRAMEIIDELEPEKRGIYGGGVGYFSAGGDMDMCIALRTAILKENVLFVQAGCGVVHDSDERTEYEESLQKAKALFAAAQGDQTQF